MGERATSTRRKSTRRLLPLENPDTTSLETARGWLTIYEQREAMLARQLFVNATSADESDLASVAAGARFWRTNVLELAGIDIDRETRMLKGLSGVEVYLTRRELELLEFLGQHPGRYFPDQVLATRAWGGGRLSGDQARIYVRRLRAKLSGTGWQLNSRRGRGYTLEQELPYAEHPSSPQMTKDRVARTIGRAHSLMVAQRLQLEIAVEQSAHLRNIVGRTDRNGAHPSPWVPPAPEKGAPEP